MPTAQPQPRPRSPAISSPGSPRPQPDTEREFIRGNRDGPGRANETYVVCRLRVSQERLDEEMGLGLHSHFLSLDGCWECPAHIFLKAAAMKRARLGHATPPPSAVPLELWRRSGLTARPAETVEIIQRDPDRSGDDSTYSICRVAVPRERMVLEVMAGLHPGYHVPRRKRLYVQGNPTESFDNVNFPESLRAHVPPGKTPFLRGNPTEPDDNVNSPGSHRAKPGLGPRDLCPLRLLRPGSRLTA